MMRDQHHVILGGPGQLPHLAPTYAAVCAISIAALSYPEAYDVIDRYWSE